MISFKRKAIFPIIPTPPKLEVAQMVREPSDEPIETRHIHVINALVQQFCSLGKDLVRKSD